MRTPRPVAQQRRGIGTLIGNGWLHEASPTPSPRLVPRGWEARGKSALRKCMFIPAPYPGFLPAQPTSLSPAPVRRPRVEEIAAPPRKVDPSRQARVMPAYIPPFPRAHVPQAPGRVAASATAWYEDPIALGSLLILLPPIGLAALWSSKRYSTDARWALTIMTGLTMSLAAAVFVAALVLRTS